MTGQYISLTPRQEKAFRSQAQNAMARGDEAFVAFVEADGHEVYLEVDQLADLAEKAAEAYDRIVAREQAEKVARAEVDAPRHVYTDGESRVNTANELRNWGPKFADVANAMSVVVNDVGAEKAAEVSYALTGIINTRRLREGSWMLKAVCLQRNEALAKANAGAERMAMIFIAPLLWVWKTLTAGEELSTRTLQLATDKFGEARPAEKWAPWALKAMERLITASHPDLYEVCIELADEVRSGLAEHRGASVLIDEMIARIPGMLEKHRQENHRRTAEKESARRARQLERATTACAKKSSKK